VPDDRVFSIDITGDEGIGKTHLACTFPKKVILCDTEFKAHTVVKKHKGVLWKKIRTFNDFRQAVETAIADPEINTVVIDSGGDLVELAGLEWNSEGTTAQGKPRNYSFPISNYKYAYRKIDELVLDLEEARVNFVATSRLKDEWINDTNTGRRIRDGYKKFPWSLTFAIRLQYGLQDSKSKWHHRTRVFGKVIKSNFQGTDQAIGITHRKPYLFATNHQGIIDELMTPWGDGVPLEKAGDIIAEQAGKWIEGLKK